MPAGAPSPSVRRSIEALQRLAELVAERRRQLAREAGVSEGEWRVLEEIAGERFMPSLFARRRAVSPAAVSRTLRQLKTRGHVRASIDQSDGRQRAYRLTPEGRRVLERLRASRARAIAAIWAPLPAAELERFGRFATTLAERLEAYAQASPALTPEGGAPSAFNAPPGASHAPGGATRRRSSRRGARR